MEALRNALERPGLRVALERAEEQPAVLLPAVEGPVGIAKDRKLTIAPGDLGDRLGDDVVVLHRDERQVVAGEPGEPARPLAGSVDHDLRADVALRRREHPAAGAPLHGGHRRVPDDLRPERGRAAGEGVGQAGRVDMPVGGQVGGGDHTFGIHDREELERALGRDELERHPERGRDTGDVVELVDAILGGGDAHGTAPVVVDGLTGLVLERLVELHAPAKQAHHVVALVELRAEPGRVPGGAARQLVLLEQHRVGEAEAGKVVEQAAAGDAAADHGQLGFREHRRDPR